MNISTSTKINLIRYGALSIIVLILATLLVVLFLPEEGRQTLSTVLGCLAFLVACGSCYAMYVTYNINKPRLLVMNASMALLNFYFAFSNIVMGDAFWFMT
jgi:hypothetical protein